MIEYKTTDVHMHTAGKRVFTRGTYSGKNESGKLVRGSWEIVKDILGSSETECGFDQHALVHLNCQQFIQNKWMNTGYFTNYSS